MVPCYVAVCGEDAEDGINVMCCNTVHDGNDSEKKRHDDMITSNEYLLK